jgi:hypothetical protein
MEPAARAGRVVMGMEVADRDLELEVLLAAPGGARVAGGRTAEAM